MFISIIERLRLVLCWSMEHQPTHVHHLLTQKPHWVSRRAFNVIQINFLHKAMGRGRPKYFPLNMCGLEGWCVRRGYDGVGKSVNRVRGGNESDIARYRGGTAEGQSVLNPWECEGVRVIADEETALQHGWGWGGQRGVSLEKHQVSWSGTRIVDSWNKHLSLGGSSQHFDGIWNPLVQPDRLPGPEKTHFF